MKQNMRKKLTPLFITMMLLVSMFIILPTSVLAATPIDDISKTDDLTCGEEIWVNASGLTEDERYYVRIWDGTEHVNLSDKKADEDGEISVSVNVPYTDTLGETYLTLWNVSGGELGNESIYINNTYDVRYKVGSEYVDHAMWNQSYEDATAFVFQIYNWTGSKYELFSKTLDWELYSPNNLTNPILSAYNRNDDEWDIDYTFNFDDDNDNLETDYWVYVEYDTDHYSLVKLPVKLDVTATLPSNAKWRDDVSISGYVKDGKGNGIGDYVVHLYSPVNGGYTKVADATTFSSGRFSLSAPTDEDGASAGTWYVGTYMTGTSYRINETDVLDIEDFISYLTFEVATLDTAKVALVSPDEIVSGFTQTINISVYDSWDEEYYDKMWIHVTGLDANYSGTEYDADDVIVIGQNFTGNSSNKKYAYYEFEIKFEKTGTATIIVTHDLNNTEYEDQDDLMANISGTLDITVVSPDAMNMIISDMVDSVLVDDSHDCCWFNTSTTITIEIYGDDEDTRMNASIRITGCGLDIDIDEDDAVDDGYWQSAGEYDVDVSPKTAGTVTITATNGTDNTSLSKDYSISGLSGSLTTSVGGDKEISVTTTETITLTVTNGQYAEVKMCYYDKDWDHEECLNETIGDGTAGNGLNGIFTFVPDEDDLDHVGFIVVVANAGSNYMYDIIEVAPIHDLVVDIVEPVNVSDQTLTVGLEHDWKFKILDGNGDVVDDIDEVKLEILDEDGDVIQTDYLVEKAGDIWQMNDFVPHFKGTLLVTALNNTGEDEHDGNVSFDVDHAVITFSPVQATAGIDQEDVTVEITGVDANGNALPDGTKLYLNIEESDTIMPQSLKGKSITLDEDGQGEFEITEVGDNKTKINCTFQAIYDDDYMGNVSEGFFMVDFPTFICDPDTIYLNQANMITVTAKDHNGQAIQGINLTFISSIPGILSAQPDPMQTGADGKATFSISPLASGKINVTIVRDIAYEGGRLNWTNAVITDTFVTVTSMKMMRISVSKTPVYQGDTFTVTVTSNEVAVASADVEFSGTTAKTDATGKATFTAPDPGVESVVYTITAEKSGYISAEKQITVIKVFDITVIGPTTEPKAGETFTVTVIAKGMPLAGATVTFNGKTSTSGGDGKITLTAPSSAGDYTLTASYGNYKSYTMTITVGEGGGVPGFELLTLVVALGAAFVLFKRRRQ